MARERVYKCTKCDQQKDREQLTVKKVQFLEMGFKGRILRSRVVAWLCPKCVISDQDFNQQERRVYTSAWEEAPNATA